MSDEAEVLLLPGLPLVNRPGENLEPDFWSFELETPRASSVATTSPPVTIDFVHPGNMGLLLVSMNMFVLPLFLSVGGVYRLGCYDGLIRVYRMERNISR